MLYFTRGVLCSIDQWSSLTQPQSLPRSLWKNVGRFLYRLSKTINPVESMWTAPVFSKTDRCASSSEGLKRVTLFNCLLDLPFILGCGCEAFRLSWPSNNKIGSSSLVAVFRKSHECCLLSVGERPAALECRRDGLGSETWIAGGNFSSARTQLH